MPVSDEMVEVAKRAYSENQFGNGLDVRLRAALEAAEAVREREATFKAECPNRDLHPFCVPDLIASSGGNRE